MKDWARIERDGKVAYVRGRNDVLRLPSDDVCREKLIVLLEKTKGDPEHAIAKEFWLERARDIADSDPMKAAWSSEVFAKLSDLWEQLASRPAPVLPAEEEVDVFSQFGL